MTVEKLDLSSPDLVQGNIEKIQALFPNVVTEGPEGLSIDFDALRQELSDTIVEGPQERYRLDWPGKRAAMLAANTPISKTLRPVREESVDFDTTQNLFIEGDNLDALKLLQDSYLGKVKMIYIDPPYNTGKDFIYKDNFTQDKAEYLEDSGQVDEDGGRLIANPDSNGRYHSDWLSMMYPRLKLARNLLRDDGVVCISIDDHEAASLEKVCCEVFGSDNFIATCAVVNNPRGRQSDKHIANAHDNLIIFSRSSASADTYGQALNEAAIKDYKFKDENGPFRHLGLRQRGAASNREDRPEMFFPIYVSPDGAEISLETRDGWHTVLPKKSSGKDGRWMWGKEKCKNDLNRLDAKFISHREEYDIVVRDYLNRDGKMRTRKFKSVWSEKSYNNQSGSEDVKALFGLPIMSFPKSVGFLSDVISFGSSENDLILDFFAGSATTAQSILELNISSTKLRSYIMVQLPEAIEVKDADGKSYSSIANLSKERIRRAGAKILKDNPDQVGRLDVGFRVFKIDSSNMKDVHADPREMKQGELLDAVSHIKADRSSEDLLFQVMLNQGIELSQSITRETVEGKTIYIVGQDNLIACFDDNITDEVVKNIAGRKPLYAIFRDESFKEPADKINAVQIFKQLTEDHTRMKVI